MSPSEEDWREPHEARISTGNPEADLILGGGYLRNTINVIMGTPGTGKSLFAQQMCFHNATGDRRVLYLTTLSEPLGKIIRFLQGYSFFDQTLFNDCIVYDELGHGVCENGVRALVDTIEGLFKEHRPKILVIDSFKAVHDLIHDLPEKRHFMHDLAGLLTAYDVTTFLVGEYPSDQDPSTPEFAVADSIVELLRVSSGSREVRYFRILKLRGSHYHAGLHAMSLSSAGVSLFPRLVTPLLPQPYDTAFERISTGVEVLDTMMNGGVWRGTTTLALGPTGSGKTTLGVQFLQEGARRGETGLYLYFQENPTQFRRRAQSIGSRLTEEQHGLIELMYRSPVEMQVDSIIGSAFQAIKDKRISRIVVDSVGDLAHATEDWPRLQDYLYSLIQYFTERSITSMLMMEGHIHTTLSSNTSHHSRLSPMSDNLVVLQRDDEHKQGPLERRLRVMKMRNSTHSLEPCAITIVEEGIQRA
jgi:circadian clock protein KaiC